MNYFNTKRPIFIVSSNKCYEEYEKIDKFIEILNKSGIAKIIKSVQKDIGRKGYDPYNLVATIIYCFSQFKSSIREIEKLCIFDLRVMYIIEQEQPSDSTIYRNIRKVFTLIDSDNIKSNYWENTHDLKKEKFPFPKQKKTKKKAE